MGLKLVVKQQDAGARETSAVERVFSHWLFMFRKPARCALGPARRKVIERALALYDEETLLLAIEGCSASSWHAGDNDRGRAYQDIALILRDEAHVERFADDGELLRKRLDRRILSVAEIVPAPEGPLPDPAEVLRRREQLRDMAAKLRGA